MKRKKIWLRWIAWILLLVLCMNSAGTTALAVSANEESILNINGSLEKEMLSGGGKAAKLVKEAKLK